MDFYEGQVIMFTEGAWGVVIHKTGPSVTSWSYVGSDKIYLDTTKNLASKLRRFVSLGALAED